MKSPLHERVSGVTGATQNPVMRFIPIARPRTSLVTDQKWEMPRH